MSKRRELVAGLPDDTVSLTNLPLVAYPAKTLSPWPDPEKESCAQSGQRCSAITAVPSPQAQPRQPLTGTEHQTFEER